MFLKIGEKMGSALDVARCKELSLLRGTWCSFDRFLDVRDSRRGDSKAHRDCLQRFIRRAPQQVDGGLVRVAVRTIEYGVHGKSIGGGHVLEDFVWREAGWVGLESGNVGQRLALHESVDAFTERFGPADPSTAKAGGSPRPRSVGRRSELSPWCERTGRAQRRRLASLALLGYPQSLDHYSTPRPPSCFCHHSGSNRIQHDIAAEFLEGTLLSHKQTFEPALQQVSHALMATIEPLGVRAME